MTNINIANLSIKVTSYLLSPFSGRWIYYRYSDHAVAKYHSILTPYRTSIVISSTFWCGDHKSSAEFCSRPLSLILKPEFWTTGLYCLTCYGNFGFGLPTSLHLSFSCKGFGLVVSLLCASHQLYCQRGATVEPLHRCVLDLRWDSAREVQGDAWHRANNFMLSYYCVMLI